MSSSPSPFRMGWKNPNEGSKTPIQTTPVTLVAMAEEKEVDIDSKESQKPSPLLPSTSPKTPERPKSLTKIEDEQRMGTPMLTTNLGEEATQMTVPVSAVQSSTPTPEEPPTLQKPPKSPSAHREELLERYHHIQKEKRDLKRRNLQAQINIVQFFRKHKLNPYPHSQTTKDHFHHRDEYSKQLRAIDKLTTDKEQESLRFQSEVQVINEKKKRLQSEVSRVIQEMTEMRQKAASNSLHLTSGQTMQQKELHEHSKSLEVVTAKAQPIRIKNAKLNAKLASVTALWDARRAEANFRSDLVEISFENQVFGAKSEETKEEIDCLKRKITDESVALAHTLMHLEQIKAENEVMGQVLGQRQDHLKQLKKKLIGVKAELVSIKSKKRSAVAEQGIGGNELLMSDFQRTQRHLRRSKS